MHKAAVRYAEIERLDQMNIFEFKLEHDVEKPLLTIQSIDRFIKSPLLTQTLPTFKSHTSKTTRFNETPLQSQRTPTGQPNRLMSKELTN